MFLIESICLPTINFHTKRQSDYAPKNITSCEKVLPLTVKWKGKSKVSKVSLFFPIKKKIFCFMVVKLKVITMWWSWFYFFNFNFVGYPSFCSGKNKVRERERRKRKRISSKRSWNPRLQSSYGEDTKKLFLRKRWYLKYFQQPPVLKDLKALLIYCKNSMPGRWLLDYPT